MKDLYEIRKDKKKDQYFLKNLDIIKRQVNYSQIQKSDIVLEIGPGPGNLTKQILRKKPKKIRVIEKDKKFVKHLKKKFGSKENIEIIHGDAKKKSFGDFDKTISNLPYSISSELTFKLLKHDFQKAIWTYQKEFAERMTAEPGSKKYSRLTVNTKVLANVELLETIPRNFFTPQPRVDSAIVKIELSDLSKKLIDPQFFKDLVRGVFTQRRKKLKNALENSIHLITDLKESDLNEIKKTLNDFLDKRPDKITPEEYIEISNKLKRTLNDFK